MPDRRQELAKLKDEAQIAAEEKAGGPEEAEDAEELLAAELAAERAGVSSTEKVSVKTQSRKAKSEAARKEEEERLKTMMTKKHKRMLLRINQRQQTKDDKVQKLVAKKAKAEAAK